jgi:hypothetical protein
MTASVPIVYVEPIEEPAANPAIAQADSDAQLVALWIGSHASPHTRRNYQRQADRFLAFVGRPLALVRIACRPTSRRSKGWPRRPGPMPRRPSSRC